MGMVDGNWKRVAAHALIVAVAVVIAAASFGQRDEALGQATW